MDVKRTAAAAWITLLVLCVPLVAASPPWEEEDQASPHAVMRNIVVPFPQLDHRAGIDPEVAAVIDAAIAERVGAMLQELLPFGSIIGQAEVTLDAQDVLSITMQYSGYHPPMAHPVHLMTSLTVDLRTGQIYRLPDLFAGDAYIDTISAEVARQIAEKEIGVFEEVVRIAPDQPFYLTPEALVIYYQVYEIAPYVFGFPRFEIPYEMLADIAKEGGPIDRMAGFAP